MDSYIQIINQLVEIRQKIKQEKLEEKFERNFNRIFSVIEDEGYIYQYPLGEKYTETRTDCEATIIGRETRSMVITQVIKPIIYKKNPEGLILVQKGIVIVENN
jgi:ribosomal protein S8